MGRKKKASTQQPEEQLLFTTEQKPTTPEVEKSSEDSTGGETINDQSGEDSGSTCTQTDSNNDIVTSKESGSLLDSEEFVQDAIKRHKECVEQMGGYEAVQKRLDLSRALLITYRNRGNSVKEIVEDVLKEYRDGVGKYGYVAIKKEMIPIIEYYGTIKDIAALCTLAYFDMERDSHGSIVPITPLLSRSRTDEIRNEVRSRGRDAMVEFMNSLSLYETLKRNFHLFYRFKYTYTSMAYQATIYFQTYEWLGKAEELFNSFAPLVPEDKQAELKLIAKNYNDYLNLFQRFGDLDEVQGDGWIDKQRGNCFEYAEVLTTEYVTNRLAELKGHITAIKLWIKKNGAEMFVPMELREQIDMLEQGYLQELQSKYYHSHLKYMEERGETITDADRKIALFPEYEEVKPDEGTKKYTLKKLDGYKETFK